MVKVCSLTATVEEQILQRNRVFERFFAEESRRLAVACRDMSDRFLRGGRLLAFGRGPYMSDAQHVSVEFVHPIIVGKRALPALDLSINFRPWLDALVQAEDIVMGFGPPEGDSEVSDALASAAGKGAMTFALPGSHGSYAPRGSYAMEPATEDPFIHQELVEILYHTLWETVHVFFEHEELGHQIGDAAFLYPFLGEHHEHGEDIVEQVAASIRAKAADDAHLRLRIANGEAQNLADATQAIHERLLRGGKLILFGNGGSATDANDWAMDCVAPPKGYKPIPAISLSMEPAILSAIANDVGIELIYMRQMIAHAKPNDVAIGISTSGGSRNVILALQEARKRGLLTIGLLGYDGGEILRQRLADFNLVIHSDYVPRIQEVQASTYHILRAALEVLARG